MCSSLVASYSGASNDKIFEGCQGYNGVANFQNIK